MMRAGEIAFLLVRYIAIFRHMKSYRNSVQIQLYNITLKMPNILIENDQSALGFLGYFMEVSRKIAVFS